MIFADTYPTTILLLTLLRQESGYAPFHSSGYTCKLLPVNIAGTERSEIPAMLRYRFASLTPPRHGSFASPLLRYRFAESTACIINASPQAEPNTFIYDTYIPKPIKPSG